MSKQSDSANMTVMRYVQTVLIPDRKANGGIAPATECSLRNAVRRLYKSEGREVKCREVNEAMLSRLDDWHRRHGYKPDSRRVKVAAVRTIVRHFDPNSRQVQRQQDPLLMWVYQTQYEQLKIRTRRESTKRLYRISLERFEEFLGRRARLSDLNDATVSAFASWRLDQKLSKKTVNRDLANLLAIWRWLRGRHHKVKTLPNVELEVIPVRVPKALLRPEIANVVAAIEAETHPVGDIPGNVFWKAVFFLIWDTAERIGAVMRLTWENVDLAQGWVRFTADDRKGGAEDNVLPIAQDTIAALHGLQRVSHGNEQVFPWPHHITSIYSRLGKIMERAGLPNDRWHKFHVFRKSVASHYEAAGGNATALLKHFGRKVTERYIDPRIARTPSAADLLFRPSTDASA